MRWPEVLRFVRWIKTCCCRSWLLLGLESPCVAACASTMCLSLHVGGVVILFCVCLGVTAPVLTVAGRETHASLSPLSCPSGYLLSQQASHRQSPHLRPSRLAIVPRHRRPPLSCSCQWLSSLSPPLLRSVRLWCASSSNRSTSCLQCSHYPLICSCLFLLLLLLFLGPLLLICFLALCCTPGRCVCWKVSSALSIVLFTYSVKCLCRLIWLFSSPWIRFFHGVIIRFNCARLCFLLRLISLHVGFLLCGAVDLSTGLLVGYEQVNLSCLSEFSLFSCISDYVVSYTWCVFRFVHCCQVTCVIFWVLCSEMAWSIVFLWLSSCSCLVCRLLVFSKWLFSFLLQVLLHLGSPDGSSACFSLAKVWP